VRPVSAASGRYPSTRAQSLSKMLRKCENEMFTFEFDSEAALVVSTLER
jgi:hypothetical protein